MRDDHWYLIEDLDDVDTPALVIYRERVEKNIGLLKTMVRDNVACLRPHVKTHKTKEGTLLMLQHGITKFKCATIAEAEMLASCNAPDVLLAYPPTGPKIQRFLALITMYPGTKFSCLIDNITSATEIATAALKHNLVVSVFIDLNLGMNRTGIAPGEAAVKLYKQSSLLQGLKVVGLHAYDGHIRNSDLDKRTKECEDAFYPVSCMQNELIKQGLEAVIVAGGSPTFYIHAKRKNIECSPGTFIYWDKGYSISCPEQPFLTAALVLTRIISLPDKTKLCLDLGHKSIASENELNKRIFFLNAPEVTFIGHSEEHLVVEATPDHDYKVGDVFYGLPFHICPTVALYERAHVIEGTEVRGEWKTIARDRKITV